MSVTTQERTSIIQLTVAMFNAAPGATYLPSLTGAYEANGRSLATLAVEIANTSIYKSLFPDSQSGSAFATAFLTPFGLQANASALAFIQAKFDAGMSKGQIAYDAVVALNASSASQFAEAKAILNNKTTAAEYYTVTVGGQETNLNSLQQVIASVDETQASVDAAIAAMTSVEQQEINLTPANDTYTIGAGNFSINGLGGDDTITTGSGQNTVTTLTGNDSITTGAGNDVIVAGDGNNTVDAGDGTNTVTTGTGNDIVTTGAGNDIVTTGTGNDIISTGAGGDLVTSGSGTDTIDLGVDSIQDTAVFAENAVANGSDTVAGFTTAIDKIDLNAMTSDTATVAVAGSLTVEEGNVYFLATGTAANADSVAASAAILQLSATWTNASNGVVAYFVVNDDNSSAVYEYIEAGGAGITLTELTLMGTVDEKIVTDDLVFA